MNIRKFKLLLNLQNILIILLVITVILSITKIIIHQTAYASATPQLNTFQEKPEEDQDIKNTLLYEVLQHVFPAGGVGDKNEIFSLKAVYQSIIDDIVFIDLNDPLTFIKTQFPAIALYEYKAEDRPVATIPVQNNTDNSGPGEETNEPVGNEGVAVNNPIEPNSDDLAEEDEGIFLIDELIDSRDNVKISLEDVVKPKKIKLEKGKPQILIYHTHGTESYKPASEDNFHTLRKEYSVITIGEIITTELEKRGYEVIHDTTYHDYPSYNGSYTRSLSTVKEILKNNPSIKIVLDIHRDGYDNIDKNPQKASLIKNNQVRIKNETSSRMQFVIGPETQNKKAVETFAQYVKAVSDHLYPDFSKPVLIKPYGKFNQFVIDHYLLVELGSNANTIDEAKRAAGHLADVLGEAFKQITE